MGKKKRRKRNTLPADRADRHRLYQWAVQVPDYEVAFIDRVFRKRRGRRPLALREDFCGTAHLSAAWVASRPDRTALGLDLDTETLAWGRTHNIAPLGTDAARLEVREQDVRAVTVPPVDVVCAYNFSYFLLHPLAELVTYLKHLRASLEPDGMVFMDCYGGWEAQQVASESRLVETDEGDFTYTWEQAAYNPLTNIALCHIHFELAGGRKLKKAFTYEWRLYTPAEVRDALLAAGFSRATVYWDVSPDEDEDVFKAVKKAENTAGWLAYIVGEV